MTLTDINVKHHPLKHVAQSLPLFNTTRYSRVLESAVASRRRQMGEISLLHSPPSPLPLAPTFVDFAKTVVRGAVTGTVVIPVLKIAL